MKKTQGFKFNLNFHIKDANPDVQKHNFVLYKSSLMSIFIFLIIFSPIFAYLVILYNNVNLDLYFSWHSRISQYLDLPSHDDICGTIWASIGLMIFAIFLLGFFKPIVTMDGMNHKRQLLFIVGIVLTMVFALLLAALSQYYYSQFETFLRYEAFTKDDKQTWIKDLSDQLTKNYDAGIDIYSWQGSTIVWWVMFFQLTVIFSLIVFLQNSVFSRNELMGIEQYINYSIKRQGVNRSRWTRRVGRLFKVSDKNLSIWLLVITFLIMIPNFAYAVLISVKGSSINALINWTYSLPNLLQDHLNVDQQPNGFNEKFAQLLATNHRIRADYFLLNSLPIITMGITFSTTFFFISIMVRGGKNSQEVFITQFIALSVEILFLLGFFLYTKLEVEYLYHAWSTPQGIACYQAVENLLSPEDFSKVRQLYNPADVIGKAYGRMDWWSQFEITAEAIVGTSFAICSLLGVAIGMVRSNQITKDFLKEKSLISLVGVTKNVN